MGRRPPPSGLTEAAVLPLATHLGTPEQARALYVLTALRQADQDRWELERLQQLHDLVQAMLGDIGLSGTDARSLITQRLRQAIVAAGAEADADVTARIESAPRSFVLRVTPEHLAACATLVAPLPHAGDVRVAVLAAPPRSGPGVTGAGAWSVVVGARDRQGLLATVSGALDDCGYDVRRAVVATWLDVPPSRSSRSGDRSCPPQSTSRRRSPPRSASPWGPSLARRPRPLRRLELTLAHDLRGRSARRARAPPPAGHGVHGRWRHGGCGVDRRTGHRCRGHVRTGDSPR